jgi:hypothetical protein
LAPSFQERCSVVKYTAGGALVAGRKRYACLAFVDESELLIIDAGQSMIDRAPLSAIELDTPALQRAVGEATFVRMNGNRWTLDFGFAAKPKRIGLPGLVKTMRTAKEINRRFRSALLAGGAVDRRSR